jgi:hypothetical protein
MLTDINPAAVDFAWGELGIKKTSTKDPGTVNDFLGVDHPSNHCFFSFT